MTMPFHVSDRASLENVKPGDRVEGTLHVIEEDGVVSDYELRDLTVARPASAQMVLDVSKGKVSLREAAEAAREGRSRARLLDDDSGRKAAQALGSARNCCCTYVYLYQMSAS